MRRAYFLLVPALFLVGMPVRGELFYFDNRADFDAATTGRTVVDFESSVHSEDFPQATPPRLTDVWGANFNIDRDASNGYMYVIGADFYYPSNQVLSSQQSSEIDDNILVALPGAFTAFALDFGAFAQGTIFTFSLSTGDTFTRTTSGNLPTLDFVGVISTIPITAMRISIPKSGVTNALNIDNVTFGNGSVAAVPEPSTLVSCSLSLVAGLTCWRQRRRRAGSRD